MKLLLLVAALTSGIDLDVPKEAHQAGAEDKGVARVHAYLLTDVSAVTPGETFRVGVLFTLDEHYHIYWKNPGQAAIATEVRFGGKGLEFGELHWPAPAIFRQADGFITTYGYTDQVVLFAKATVAENERHEIKLSVQADYLACKVECTPGSASLSRTIPIRNVSTPAPPHIVQLFDHFAARVPKPAKDLGLEVSVAYDVSAVKPSSTFKAALGIVACAGAPAPGEKCTSYQVPGNAIDEAFVPDRTPGIELEPIAAREHPGAYSGLVIDVAGTSGPDDPSGDTRFSGVVELESDDGKPAFVVFDAPLPRVGTSVVTRETLSTLLPVTAAPAPIAAPVISGLSLWQALLLAFIGGLVLNLMPCVLPVLAIKVTGFTQLAKSSSTHGRRIVFAHAMAYTGGIVVAMLCLALAVLALRFGGHAVGWGFQFQEPLFVAIVAGVLVAFALNLFGVFEVAVGAGALADATGHARGLTKSALEGVLAVVVATPCSAPYLGTAVGFALAGEAWIVVAAFVTIGLGLAAPFVILTLVPRALALVPKPGMWMVRFKQMMGFALLATVLWLGWVVGNVAGIDGMAAVLGFALAVGLATWMFASSSTRMVQAVAVLIVAISGFGLLRFEAGEHTVVKVSASADELTWQPFAKDRISAELAKGNVVFVDFTAEWCITCKVNERAVLGSQRIVDTAKKLGVQLFKADWTRRDEVIRAELAAHGKAGVPMYLVYSPKTPDEPTVLPELLTADAVVVALEQAGK